MTFWEAPSDSPEGEDGKVRDGECETRKLLKT